MTSNHSNLNMEAKKQTSKQNDNIKFNTLRNYITLTNYYTVKDTFR